MVGGRGCIYSNAIEKLFEVTCVLTLIFHDDPKNDLDERYIWSDVTLSMSRFPFLCYSLSLSLSLYVSTLTGHQKQSIQIQYTFSCVLVFVYILISWTVGII